ncbi:MAG: hypothetical protein Q9162_003963 [Coniocarpon cinnabarinum]
MSHKSETWPQLQRPLKFSLFGLDTTGKNTLLKRLSPNHVPSDQAELSPHIKTVLPRPGFSTDVLTNDKLTVTSFWVGGPTDQPLKPYQQQVVRENKDGAILIVDIKDREGLSEIVEKLGWILGELEELRKMPLLVLVNDFPVTTQIPMHVDEVEKAVRAGMANYQKGGERPLTVKKVNVKTGEGVKEAMDWLIDAAGSQSDPAVASPDSAELEKNTKRVG